MATSRPSSVFICRACRHNLFTRPSRPFSTTVSSRADDSKDPFLNLFSSPSRTKTASTRRPNNALPQRSPSRGSNVPGQISQALEGPDPDSTPESLLTTDFHNNSASASASSEPHRLHIFAHKHNTHISFVQPSKPASETPHLRSQATAKTTAAEQNKKVSVLLSLSAGNIGFKKAGRGSYDAAFQLAAFVFKQMQEKGMQRDVRALEVILRGFGAGREAVTKALMGTEGRFLRNKITAVADATRLKQGGPRGKKPRRLG